MVDPEAPVWVFPPVGSLPASPPVTVSSPALPSKDGPQAVRARVRAIATYLVMLLLNVACLKSKTSDDFSPTSFILVYKGRVTTYSVGSVWRKR